MTLDWPGAAGLAAIKQRMDKARQETLQIQAGDHALHKDINALVTKAMANSELARFVNETVGGGGFGGGGRGGGGFGGGGFGRGGGFGGGGFKRGGGF